MSFITLIMKEWKIILPLLIFTIGFGSAIFFYLRAVKRKEYKLETLRKNGLANSFTVIKRNKILKPNASSDDFQKNLNLICELQLDNSIISCKARKNEIIFERANFSKAKKINSKPQLLEVGINHQNKPFILKAHSGILGIPAGAGKTVLLNSLILSHYLNKKHTEFEIVIADSHSSFAQLQGIPNIKLFALENPEEKEAFLAKLEEIKEYQKTIDLSVFETLEIAKNKKAMLDKKEFLIVIDEFSENFSSPNSKHPSYKLNQEIILAVEKIFTSGRKYSQLCFIAYQSDTSAEALVNENYANSRIYGYMASDTAKAKNLPTNHPLLKERGTFYFSSRNHPACFFRTYPVLKEDLPNLLRGKS